MKYFPEVSMPAKAGSAYALAVFGLIAVIVFTGACHKLDNDKSDDTAATTSPNKSFLHDLPEPGVESVTSIETLPLLQLHSRTRQTSSHDLTGGNQDGFRRGTQFYVDEQGDYVVFDDYGPGCVYRMWFTGFTSWLGRIKIYVDDLDKPVIDKNFIRFFLGFNQLFKFPRVYFFHQSSGGFASYVPICYQKRCRIALSMKPEFFQITSRRYDADTKVQPFSQTRNVDNWDRQWSAENLGKDPKGVNATHAYKSSASVSPEKTEDLLVIEGAGAIWSIRIKIEPFEQRVIDNLYLKAWWDDEDKASIDVPVNEFFGAYYIHDTPRSLLIGRDDGDYYYCYFPMPFWSKARIAIKNRGDDPVEIEADIEAMLVPMRGPYSSKAGYFRAYYAKEKPTVIGKDFIALDTDGAGHFVGITHTMESSSGQDYMEGDERIYADGSASPALYGTGTEDYYNGGWYYILGTFAQALHGAPTHISEPGFDMATSYRMHLGDTIPFAHGFRFGIEHDRGNTIAGDDYHAVAYYYHNPRVRTQRSDTLDIGNAESEASHNYQDSNAVTTDFIQSYYEGDSDQDSVRDRGRIIADSCSFSMTIDPANDRVFLRRLYDQLNGLQTARVLVAGHNAGTWFDLAHNPHKRFADSDFLIPASLTKGRESILIRLENIGPAPWTQFRFEAFSVVTDEHRDSKGK